MTDAGFARPEVLGLGALACGALLALAALAGLRRRRALRRFAVPARWAALTLTVAGRRRALKLALLVLAVAALFVALARPHWGSELVERERRAVDVVFAVDVSRSMGATDVRPDRLRRATLAVLDLARELEGDRVGLVAFAGDAVLHCPMTLDRDVFERAVAELDTELVPRGTTNLELALREALSAFGDTGAERIVILLSDGEALAGDAQAAAEEARAAGARVLTIGVGTPEGAPVPVRGPRGERTLLTRPDGELVHSSLDAEALEALAEATGGGYRALGPSGEGLAALHAEHLAALPRHAVAARFERVPLEQMRWPLGLAVALLLIEPLVGERRRPRGAVLAASAVALLLALIAPRALASPERAEQAYARGEFHRAERLWAASAARDPALRYNQGVAAYRAGRWDAAARAFAAAVRAGSPALQQRALYALGNAAFRRAEARLAPDDEGVVAASDREAAREAWRTAAGAYRAAQALAPGPAGEDARHNLALVEARLAALEAATEGASPDGDPRDGDPRDGDRREDGDSRAARAGGESDSAEAGGGGADGEDAAGGEADGAAHADMSDTSDTADGAVPLEADADRAWTAEEALSLLRSLRHGARRFPMDGPPGDRADEERGW